MIKLAILSYLPLAVAFGLAQLAPDETQVGNSTKIEREDRHFLTMLKAKETARIRDQEIADRSFLARLQTRDPAPAAALVRAAAPALRSAPQTPAAVQTMDGFPVRRAIALTAPASTRPLTASSSDLRTALREPAVTQVQPVTRQVQPVGDRARIIIRGNEVVVVPSRTQG